MFIDFSELKKQVTIEQVVDLLGLELKKANNQLRGKCPACDAGDRSLVITPEKQAYYCFADEKGGDLIALAAHIKGISTKDAAQWIHSSLTVPQKEDRSTPEGLQPLSHLDFSHELVIAIGLSPEQAELIGIGRAKKGLLAGALAVPLRTETGVLVGYLKIKEAELPYPLKLPNTNVVKFPRTA